eukprot:jgi/Mesvir1/1616/Mv05058-RA.1
MVVADCRMYEKKYPEVDDVVMVQVKSIAEMGAYVSLLEYNGIEGMILLSELSRRRIRSISKLIKVGQQQPVMVLRVDKEKGYIDLSKRRVSSDDMAACEERFNNSKLVHSIMRHVAETQTCDLEELYQTIAWPLYRKYGHAVEAFKQIVADPDAILGTLEKTITIEELDGSKTTKTVPALSPDIKEELVKNIKRRLTPQALKIRAEIELTCFRYDGVLHIKSAMRAGEAVGSEAHKLKIKLIAPPLYELTTHTLDKESGMKLLTDAIAATQAVIEENKGKLVVKEAPRPVSERDDRLFAEKMDKLAAANAEVAGDEESSGEEDEGMGDIDVEKSSAMEV